MFGDFSKKIQEAQAKAEEVKQRLSMIEVKGTAGEGRVEVIMTGNRELKDIRLGVDPKELEKEELEDLLSMAVRDAINRANSVNEAEMGALARDAMPNIPGLGKMFGK